MDIEQLKKENEAMKATLYSIAWDDPYPTDIFPPITPDQWKAIHHMIEERFGFPIDRLSAEYGRRLRKPLIDEAKNCLAVLKQNL